MDIRPIHTDQDNDAALRRIETLWGATSGTPEGDELDILVALVAHYEESRWPTPEAGPPAAFLRAFMALSGRAQGDLAKLLGSKSRASEILNGKRDLNVDQIRLLRHRWGVPADCLIGDLQAA
jgi:HTH-type transcriptional regulator/antitoxin HigA